MGMTEEYVRAAHSLKERAILTYGHLSQYSPEPRRRELYASAIG